MLISKTDILHYFPPPVSIIKQKSENGRYIFLRPSSQGHANTPVGKADIRRTNNAVSSPEEQNPDATSQATQEPEAPVSGTEPPRETEQTAAPSAKEPEPAAAANPKQDVSGTSSPSVGNSSTAPKDEESSNTVNGTSESTWDKQSQASGSEKPNGVAAEETKEKTAGKEKEKKSAPPKELKAAPLPSVNIWQQRKEAQDARVKVTGNLKPAAPAAKTGASKTASTASSTSGENQQDQPKASSKKKGADGVPEGAAKHRNKADGGKGRDEGKLEIGSKTCGSYRKFEYLLGTAARKTLEQN